MITLASLIERFETACLAQYRHALLPSHLQALQAMKRCRTSMAPRMLAQCSGCDEQLMVPHSCGHRSCPHCQHFESQRWLERQTQRLVAGSYFLVSFTLPAELRPLAWQHQRIVYDLLMDCAWQTLRTFSQNHRHLQGSGATFLWLLLRHVLPKGFRRARNHGFLHPNSKRLIALLRLLVFRQPPCPEQPTQRAKLVCRYCGEPMIIVKRRIPPISGEPPGGVAAVKT